MSAETTPNSEASQVVPLSALVDLRNEFATNANKKGELIQMLIGKLAIPADDSQVSFALGVRQTFTEVVQALDAVVAAQNLDEDLITLTEVTSDPNIDRLEDL